MTGAPPLRAVVIDLFHTLVDPREFKPDDFWRVPAVAGLLDLDVDTFSAAWADAEDDRNRGLAPRNAEAFAAAVRAAGREPDPERIAAADEMYGRYQDRAVLEPPADALDALGVLRESGLRVGLLSNAEPRDVHEWERSPLAALVDAPVFSYEIGHVKPEQESYAAALDAVGARPDEAAYVGDGAGGELLGAREQGFARVVAARTFVPGNGMRTEAEQRALETCADAVVTRFADLPQAVRPA